MMQVWRDCCTGCKKATVVTDHAARIKRCSHCGLEDGVDVKENDTVRRLSDPIGNSGLSIVTTRSTTDPANGSFVDFLSPNLEDSLKPVSTVDTTELKKGSSDRFLSLTLEDSLKPVSTVDTEMKNGSSDGFLSLTLGNTQKPEMNTASSDEYSLKPGFDTDSIVTTELKNGTSDDFLSLTLGNSQNPETIAASSDGVIVSISAISDGLKLPARVKDHANQIFKEVEKYSIGKKRKERMEPNVLFAACIYIACRHSDNTRSMGEISVVANEAPILDITKAIGFIAGKLKMNKNGLMSIKAVDFIKRFCSELGLDSDAVKAAHEAAKDYDIITDSSRSPVSVAAGIVYAIARLSYEKKLLKDLIEVTGIAEQTIKVTYKDLYPKLSTITPTWFAKQGDLKNLGRP